MNIKPWIGGAAAGALMTALAAFAHDALSLPERPAGSNQILKVELATAPGLEVIVSDVVIPANSSVPKHYHPGEEFVAVVAGSAIHVEEGVEDRIYEAGEAFVIRKGKVHGPRAGAEPVRAIVFRVHVKGEPERTLVD